MKTEITGTIGRIEARYTPKGTAVVNFSVAENRTDQQGEEHTNWFNIVAWSDLAEKVNENCSKGSFVQVKAYRVEAQAWVTDGEARGKVVFTAGDVDYWVGKKKVDGGHFVSVKEAEELPEFTEENEIPF